MLPDPNPHIFRYQTIIRKTQIFSLGKNTLVYLDFVISDYLDIEEVTDSEGEDAYDEEGVPDQGRVPRRYPATFHDVHP